MTAQVNRAIKNSVLTYRGIQWELVSVGKRKNKRYYLVSNMGKTYYYIDHSGNIAESPAWLPNKTVWIKSSKIAFNEKQLKVLIKTLLQREGRYWTFKDHLNLLKAKIRYRILHR